MGVGVFGKIPTHGDFVSAGTGSRTGRSFERWLQMANDKIAHEGASLPPGPLGFCFLDESRSSALIGAMVASEDKVGRRFPLSVFCEVEEPSALERLSGFPPVLAPVIGTCAEITAQPHASAAALKECVQEIELPPALPRALDEALARLRTLDLALMLRRAFPRGTGALHASSMLKRACELAAQGSSRDATVVEIHVTSDMEMVFWLACACAAVPAEIGPPSALWDVPSQRLLLVLGTFDSNLLNLARSVHVEHRRLWRATSTDPAADERASQRLPAELVTLVERPDGIKADRYVATFASM